MLLLLAGVGAVSASRGGGKGSDARFIYSVLDPASPGTRLMPLSLALQCLT